MTMDSDAVDATHTLLRLSEERLELTDPAEDVRGYTVIDRDREEIGSVEDLIVDDREKKVRFLQVQAGGFLGMGGRHFLVPVDAVVRIHDDHVHVDQARDHVAGGPAYEPDVVSEDALRDDGYYGGVYRHYGYSPFWAPGYAYPAYPFYRP